jgi:prephenate dehydrogenase
MAAAAASRRFVGGHPIAGAAPGGREHARADLFAGKPWILTRGETCTHRDAERVESFVAALGAVPRWMDAQAHDNLFAVLSHLPQLTISALMDVVGRAVPEAELSLAGPGLRDSTRLASSPSDIWSDIVATNAIPVRHALDALIAALVRVRDDETGGAVREVFAGAASTRASLAETP